MKRMLAILALIFFFATSQVMPGEKIIPPIESLIGASAVKDAVSDIQIESAEQQGGKSVKNSILINVIAVIPFNTPRKQIKPTLLFIIKRVKEQHAHCEWISVSLVPCKKGRTINLLMGMGDYKEGCITIRYGVPGSDQIKDATRLKMLIADIKSMRLAEFKKSVNICTVYNKHHVRLAKEDLTASNPNGIFDFNIASRLNKSLNQRALNAAAKELKMPAKKIGILREKLHNYYMLAWGNESMGRC